jgi:hypothetical protein
MTELSGPAPYDALRSELMDLRRRAGNPTYRRMAAAWGPQPSLPVFSASTIADNLNGRRRSMSQEFVRFFVHSCWAHARRTGVALPVRDRSWAHWYGLWRAQAPAWEFAPAGAVAATAPAAGRPAAPAAPHPGRVVPLRTGVPARDGTSGPSAGRGYDVGHNPAAVSGVA